MLIAYAVVVIFICGVAKGDAPTCRCELARQAPGDGERLIANQFGDSTQTDVTEAGAVILAEWNPPSNNMCKFQLSAGVKYSTLGSTYYLDHVVFKFGASSEGFMRGVQFGEKHEPGEQNKRDENRITHVVSALYIFDNHSLKINLENSNDTVVLDSETCPYRIEFNRNLPWENAVTLDVLEDLGHMTGSCGTCGV